jgi:hypothetical protein
MKYIRIIETGMGEEFRERVRTHKPDSTERTLDDGARHQVCPQCKAERASEICNLLQRYRQFIAQSIQRFDRISHRHNRS